MRRSRIFFRFLVAGYLLIACAWFFRSILDIETRVVYTGAKYTLPTGAAYQEDKYKVVGRTHWATLLDLSDDGKQVIVGVNTAQNRHGSFSTTFEKWNLETGTNETPPLWSDSRWQHLLQWTPDPIYSAERGIWNDEKAWVALSRLGIDRECWFTVSPDGRLYSRVVFGKSAGCNSNAQTDDPENFTRTDVIEAGTDKLIARLSAVIGRFFIAPNSQIAVASDCRTKDLQLWDLNTAQPRAQLLADGKEDSRITFSRDSHYVFCKDSNLTWWETKTGRQAGHVDNVTALDIIEDGRTLATASEGRPTANILVTDGRIRIWDLATGVKISEWEPAGSEGHWSNGVRPRARLVGADTVNRLVAEIFSQEPNVLLLDVSRQRELKLPDQSGILSRNGRWFASIDKTGVIRVWDPSNAAIQFILESSARMEWSSVIIYSLITTIAAITCVAVANRLCRAKSVERWRRGA